MATEKKQFKVKKHKHHRTVGRLGGGYVVGGIPWSQLYYGGYGYYSGVGPGNSNNSGQESGNDGDTGAGDGASDGGGSGAM
jgi:hypothetical protein